MGPSPDVNFRDIALEIGLKGLQNPLSELLVVDGLLVEFVEVNDLPLLVLHLEIIKYQMISKTK